MNGGILQYKNCQNFKNDKENIPSSIRDIFFVCSTASSALVKTISTAYIQYLTMVNYIPDGYILNLAKPDCDLDQSPTVMVKPQLDCGQDQY